MNTLTSALRNLCLRINTHKPVLRGVLLYVAYDQPDMVIVGDADAGVEGFCRISRSLVDVPCRDLLGCETPKPNLDDARRFAEAIQQT